ncbi:Vegetative incompatibility protein HET-E-1 [Grifola frondosa]|uniref:Vegetative incompatibility protein HET-E-1 n=1 Tax=Grifola frondosa TaxID=5627 RepID=A0A1C7LLA2_GRIFR|nr:Vegetative incompatibility protein HET-E-1 [Grifola frondosa]
MRPSRGKDSTRTDGSFLRDSGCAVQLDLERREFQYSNKHSHLQPRWNMSCFQLGCSRASDDTTDDFLSASKMLLDVASETLSYTPLSGLSTATIVLSSIVGKIMTMRENDTTRRDLAERIHSLAVLIRKTTDNINDKVIKTFSKEHKDDSTAVEFVVSPELNERVERLLMTLRSIDQKADQISNNTFIWRCLCSERNANILKSLGDEIEGQITIEMLVNGLAGQLKSVVQGVDNIQYSQDEERNRAILESLPHADARYGSALHALKAGFLEGTRTALIEELHAWATGTNPDLREKPVYILSGVAGSGKSTIAYEMARRLDKAKILGASFFFLRGAEGLNSTRLFFSTIAYQLAHSQAALRPHIVHAAGNHVKRGVQQLEFEIDGLIKRPLLKARTDTRPVVIIIDAVDECTEDAQTLVPRMLHLLLKCMLEISFPLRVLITTRPELHIEHALESVRFAHITKPFKLHDIPRLTVDEDIRHYLKTRIQAIPWSAELLNERPDVVSTLTERAEGLFIYAKLAIDFLSSDPGFVEENLNILLSENPSNGTAALDQLDKLYITVLDKAFPNIDREEAIRDPMRRILGCIALLQDHISPNVLASVIGMKVRKIQSILGRLGAIIVYDACDLDAKIHYLHASFPQFLLDRRRCASAAFRVDATVQHRNFAVACLSVMVKDGVLCRNICRLSDPLFCKDRIKDISARVETHIPLHVQYACLHWATHLCDADRDTELADLLRIFGTKKLLFWLEALSMMGRLDVAVLALLKARDWCEWHDETRELLKDGYRFVLEYYVPIDSCPEHIYTWPTPQ